MPHTPLHDWAKRDRKAKEEEDKELGRPIRKPPKKLTAFAKGMQDKASNLQAQSQAKRKKKIKKLKDFAGGLGGFLPGVGVSAAAEKGAEALAKKKSKRRIPGKMGGGMVRGYSSGGKVRGAGMAKKGVRKAKMVKMKG